MQIYTYIYIAYFGADFFKATKINMHKNDSDNIQLILTKIIHTEYAVLHRKKDIELIFLPHFLLPLHLFI